MVLWRPTRPSRTNTQKRCLFHYRGLECKGRKSRNTWNNRQIWPWSTEWSRAKANRVLPRESTGHSKHPLPTTQEKTLHMDITSRVNSDVDEGEDHPNHWGTIHSSLFWQCLRAVLFSFAETLLCQQRSVWSRLWFFQWSCMDVRVGLWRKLSAEKLILLNCGVREDSWKSLGLQGHPTSPS